MNQFSTKIKQKIYNFINKNKTIIEIEMQASLAESRNRNQDEFDENIPVAHNAYRSKPQPISDENYQFKLLEFFEFLIYFLINMILGPFSMLLLSLKSNGSILAKNLCIFKGLRDWKHISIYLIKVFCVVTTFTLSYEETSSSDNQGTPSNTVFVQLYVVIYTEISIAVLLAAYYSSFTKSDIERIKNDPNFVENNENIVDKLLQMSREAKKKDFSRKHLNLNLPEIDLDRFNLIYTLDHKSCIPYEIKYRIANDKDRITYRPLKDFIVVDGISYSQYILGRTEYGYLGFQKALKYSYFLSRILVSIRVIVPILTTIYSVIFNGDTVAAGLFQTILFILEEIGYSYLIFRFCLVYDVLFLGILIYIQKYKILDRLDRCIQEDVVENKEKDPLKIDNIIPSNIQTWYNVRKLLSNVNQQIVTIVDVNMSFIAIFLIIVILIFAVSALGLLSNIGFIKALALSFTDNKQLVAITYQFILVFVIILLFSLAIGMLINMFFQSDINILTTHMYKVTDLRIFWAYYCEQKSKLVFVQSEHKYDIYVKYMKKLKQYFGLDKGINDGDQPENDGYLSPDILEMRNEADEKEKIQIEKDEIEGKIEKNKENEQNQQNDEEFIPLKNVEFETEYTVLITQLEDETRNVINKLNFDLIQNPHKILGVATEPKTFITVASVISAVGISSINVIIGKMSAPN